MEVTWKVVAVILHRRLTTGIMFHDALHRFREGCGTGMYTVLYVIFLDLTKAYDALDRSRRLEILKGYRVGDRM